MSNNHSGVEKARIKEILSERGAHLRFIGAGGAGMYPLLLLCSSLGYRVSGSDRECTKAVSHLIDDGYDISVGGKTLSSSPPSLAVYSLAVSEDDPELSAAMAAGVPCVSRAQLLGAVMDSFSTRVGVSGSHGKTTVTAMLDAIMTAASLGQTTLLGADIPSLDSHLRLGGREMLLYEACEYKDSFLYFSPSMSVFTNLELDHVDYFSDLGSIRASFLKAANLSSVSLVNLDDGNLSSLIPEMKCRVVTYGEDGDADYRARIMHVGEGLFSLIIDRSVGQPLEIRLSVPGRHNAMNALAAASAALELGVRDDVISAALSAFRGVGRRLELIGRLDGIPVYYDYAHHPTEIKCAIEALRAAVGEKIAVVFRAHTYSRTAAFLREFADALSLADAVMLSEIDGIREAPIDGVNAASLAALIGGRACVISDLDIRRALLSLDTSAIVLMGAANLDSVRRAVLGEGGE